MHAKSERLNLLLVIALAANLWQVPQAFADETAPLTPGQSPAQATPEKPFKLKLRKDDKFENQGLQRGKDLAKNKRKGDTPFASGEDVLEANPESFKAPEVMKAPKPLNGNVDQSGGGELQNQTPTGSPTEGDGMNETPAPPVQQLPPQAADPNDPDNSPDMKLLWDQWHKRVAATIFDRFNFIAKSNFNGGPPLLAQIGYVVTRDGQIKDVTLRKSSQNALFNTVVVQAVKSLNGEMAVLQFPQGSRRMFVPKVGDFMKNYGFPPGYKHQKDDHELIKGK